MGSARTFLWRRIVAASVAIFLSGTPRLMMGADAGPASHGCMCHHASGDDAHCNCPAHAGMRAAVKKPPCCHRRAGGDHREAPRPGSAGPCLTAGCGAPEARLPPTGVDVFVLPLAPAMRAANTSGHVLIASTWLRTIHREPETPPPRAS